MAGNNIHLASGYTPGTTGYSISPGQRVGQSFTPVVSGDIDSAIFRVSNSFSATGSLRVDLHAHSGTFGTSSVPGALIASSDSVSTSTIVGDVVYNFSFTGANRVAITKGTNYVIVVNNVSGTGNVTVRGHSSGTHAGNKCFYNASIWDSDSAADLRHAVYVANQSGGMLSIF